MKRTNNKVSYEYYYNMKSGKLQTTEESADKDFVDWFNGEIPNDKLPDSIDGYDDRRRRTIQQYIEMLEEGTMIDRAALAEEGEKDRYKIHYEIVDSVIERVSINGNYKFETRMAIEYSPKQLARVKFYADYLTQEKREYDKEKNSATIVSGDVFYLKNGYQLLVGENSVKAVGEGKQEDEVYAKKLANGMDALIRFSNAQGFSENVWFWTKDLSRDFIEIIKSTGVDVSREFTINEVTCVINEDGKVGEAGNIWGIPEVLYQEQLQQYERYWKIPLNQRTGSIEQENFSEVDRKTT